MSLVDRVNRGVSALRRQTDAERFSLDDLAESFLFGGNAYPLGMQTSMGTIDEEKIAGTNSAAFKTNAPIYALVQARMQAFSQVRFQWTQFVGSQPGDLFGSKELSVLERPWPGGTTSDLLARMEIHASLAGCAYIVRPQPDRLSVLRPDRVTIIMGSHTDAQDPSEAPDCEIAGFIHSTSHGTATAYLPNEVAYYAPIPDPDYRFLGMSWITPVIREMQADSLMTEHKARFMTNAATPNLAIKFDPTISIEQVKRFKAVLETEHRGAWNAYKCLHPDTDVAMWDGRRVPARGVAAGDVVVAWRDGCAVPGTVAAAEWQPPSPIVTVTTERGRVIRTNDQHPFLVAGERGIPRRTAPRWVDAADLRPGHLLTTGLGWGGGDGAGDLTTHEGWLLGALTGDGCMVSTTPVVSAWDEEVRARFGRDHELRHTGKGHDYRMLGVTKLARAHGLMGTRSWEKRIPESVMTGTAQVRAAFLSGLIDTDGHVGNPATRRSMELGITSVSRELLADAQHLLAGLGINTSLSCIVPAGRHSDRAAYRLCAFGNTQARRLAELLDLACQPKRERLARYAATVPGNRRDSSRYDRVVRVEITEPEPTIGIEIADVHTHVTGGVVTHNTLYLGGGADPVVIGKDFRQLDFSATQGKSESRLASAAGVPPSWVGFSEGLQGSSLNAGNFQAARRRFSDGTIYHLWTSAATALETLVRPPNPGASLWFDSRVPFMREDAGDLAAIQSQQAATIGSYIKDGFIPETAVKAVMNNDPSLLRHSGLVSVQLIPADGSAPPGQPGDATSNGKAPSPIGGSQ